MKLRVWAIAAAVAVFSGCGGSDTPPDQTAPNLATIQTAPGNETQILVLSNRADLISGGDALLEIKWPVGARLDKAKITVNDVDVTSAFATRANGRYMGLVTGLANGPSQIKAHVPGSNAFITITNFPIGGPIISGEQVGPWVCTTKVANPTPTNPDLGDPIDEQCNIAAPVYRYQYRTLAGTFAVYDPANPPPPGNIATATTDQGNTVPYIVRIERGVINRGKYDVAYLANPANPTAGWQPWSVPSSWNRKLFWKFGSGCEFGRTQGNPGNVLDDVALRRGFMVASSDMTQYGSHCNDVTSAETVMMVKEYVTERYGEIRYTMSDGSSGGAHQQHLHVSNYPGLLQGILPSDGWQDTWTTGREFADCGLLKRFYDTRAGTPDAYTVPEKAAINGHRWNQVCEGPAQINMASRTPFYLDPEVGGAGCGTSPDRWSETNLTGFRCTLQDFNIAIFGRRAPDATDPIGYAKTPHHNIGIQYGFNALDQGKISVEKFVALNEQIGGYNINGRYQLQRMQADPGAAEIAHASGRVPHGRGLGQVAVIADISFNITEEHYDFRNYVIRNRVLSVWGDHGNHVIWRRKGNPPDYAARRFDTLNEWLAAVEADTSSRSLRAKIIASKPALALDSCWRSGLGTDGWSTDPVYCNTSANPHMVATLDADGVPQPTIDEWPVYRDTRVASGESLASNIMKCQLKPLNPSDYTVMFNGAQWARLLAVFPQGVCDYSKSGVGQVEPNPWQTFINGPGGVPLGDPPVSSKHGG